MQVMQKSLPKLENVRTVSKRMFSPLGCIASIAAGLLFLAVPPASSVEVLIPIPAEASPHGMAGTSNVEIKIHSKLKGVQNSPPFDFTKAKKCEAELKRRKIKFTVLDKITDTKGCLVERPLKLSALSEDVVLTDEITARCEVVLAFDDLVSRVAVPSAKLHLDKKLAEIKTSTSYQCRTRNGAKGAKVSEHGFANALDITGFKFDDGTILPVSPKTNIASKDDLNIAKFQAVVRAGSCAYFTTVLGPGTNADHNDHFHFDLAHRKSGYRLCQ